MHTDQLEYFVAIAESLSFTEASYNLMISQSALSKQITKLEDELNVKLFSREKRQLQLTPAGHDFFIYAQTALKNYRTIKSELSRYSAEKSITIGSIDHLGKVGLTEPIASFMDQFSENNLHINIQKGYAQQVVSWLLEGKTDICFTAKIEDHEQHTSNLSDFDLTDYYCRDLISDEYYAIVPSHHPLAKRTCIDWEELKDERLIILDKQNSVNGLIRNRFSYYHITPHIAFECNQSDALLKMVEDGYGITFLSGLIAATTYDVRKIKMKQPLSRYTTMIVKNSQMKQKSLVSQFASYVEAFCTN